MWGQHQSRFFSLGISCLPLPSHPPQQSSPPCPLPTQPHKHCTESLPQTSRRRQIGSVIMGMDQHGMSANLQKVQCLLDKDVITQCTHPFTSSFSTSGSHQPSTPIASQGEYEESPGIRCGQGIRHLTCNKEYAWNP